MTDRKKLDELTENKDFYSFESVYGSLNGHRNEVYVKVSEIIMTERIVHNGDCCSAECLSDGRPTVRIWIKGMVEPVQVFTNEHLVD